MGRNDDDDKPEREKLSWREIDQLSNRSRHVDRGQKSHQERTLRSDWAKKQHLRQAEKFFQGKKGSDAYQKAHAAIHDQYGTPQFSKAAHDFVTQFGLPDDWGTLLLLLDHPDPKVARDALLELKGMVEKRSLIEQKGFQGKVRTLAIMTRDPDLRAECDKLLDE